LECRWKVPINPSITGINFNDSTRSAQTSMIGMEVFRFQIDTKIIECIHPQKEPARSSLVSGGPRGGRCIHYRLRAGRWSRFLPRRGKNYSVVTVAFSPSSAARMVCQARVAHFTRTGYSRTPKNTASLPKSARSGCGLE
jgi:hypothetical protein